MEETFADPIRRLKELSPLSPQGVVQWIDIFLVAYIFYRVLRLIRGRQAWRIVVGVVTFILALSLSERFHLGTLHYVLQLVAPLAPVALVILYLPELRQALEGFSRLGMWSERLLTGEEPSSTVPLEEVVLAVGVLSEKRTGALVVIERGGRLDEVAETGIDVNARVSAALIETFFYADSPLHDGAILIRNNVVVAAACRLPLSENPNLGKHMHMRHRAGLGVTEHADCVAVIVSEERGRISVAYDGRVVEMGTIQDLRDKLSVVLGNGKLPVKFKWSRSKKP